MLEIFSFFHYSPFLPPSLTVSTTLFPPDVGLCLFASVCMVNALVSVHTRERALWWWLEGNPPKNQIRQLWRHGVSTGWACGRRADRWWRPDESKFLWKMLSLSLSAWCPQAKLVGVKRDHWSLSRRWCECRPPQCEHIVHVFTKAQSRRQPEFLELVPTWLPSSRATPAPALLPFPPPSGF